MFGDFELTAPRLLLDPPLVRESTETVPSAHDDGSSLQVGQQMLIADVGNTKYWTGSEWKPVTFAQRLGELNERLRSLNDALEES